MNWDEKYNFVNDLYYNFDEESYTSSVDLIYALSKDKSPVIRSCVAKVCSIAHDNEMLNILLNLSNDCNNLVRVEVADSLCSFMEDSSYFKLINMCYDDYYMVRGYAEYGVGIVGNTDSRKDSSLRLVHEILGKEKRFFNRINCYAALYYLGEDNALSSLFSIYHRLKYRDKCVLLNFLIEILSKDNYRQIISFLEDNRFSDAESVDFLTHRLIELSKNIDDGETG